MVNAWDLKKKKKSFYTGARLKLNTREKKNIQIPKYKKNIKLHDGSVWTPAQTFFF